MKTKSITLLFVIAALLLGAGFLASKKFIKKSEKTATRAKVVTPKGAQENGSDTDEDKLSSGFNSENFDTFIPLLPNETLINSITIDFNNDGYDDEVITVRKSSSEDFIIIPAYVEISAPSGTSVAAVLDGRIVSADWSELEGCTVRIQHDNDVTAIYRHAGKLLKSVGEQVKAGTAVATVGETGELSQAHILIELRYKNQPVDPALYIEF